MRFAIFLILQYEEPSDTKISLNNFNVRTSDFDIFFNDRNIKKVFRNYRILKAPKIIIRPKYFKTSTEKYLGIKISRYYT